MKVLMSLIFVPAILWAEGLSQSDMQNIQMLRAQTEMKQREDDFKNPVKVAGTENRASEGSADAPILIVAFSDFQCPYCKNGAEAVAEIRKKYGRKIRFQFRQMPLNFHPYALPAAKRFEALSIQSAKLAYKFHDFVFQNQSRLAAEGEVFLDDASKKIGANVEKLKKDMATDVVTNTVNGDIAEAQRLGITGTPAFIVAGVRLFGAYPASEFSKVIDRRLKEKK